MNGRVMVYRTAESRYPLHVASVLSAKYDASGASSVKISAPWGAMYLGVGSSQVRACRHRRTTRCLSVSACLAADVQERALWLEALLAASTRAQLEWQELTEQLAAVQLARQTPYAVPSSRSMPLLLTGDAAAAAPAPLGPSLSADAGLRLDSMQRQQQQLAYRFPSRQGFEVHTLANGSDRVANDFRHWDQMFVYALAGLTGPGASVASMLHVDVANQRAEHFHGEKARGRVARLLCMRARRTTGRVCRWRSASACSARACRRARSDKTACRSASPAIGSLRCTRCRM